MLAPRNESWPSSVLLVSSSPKNGQQLKRGLADMKVSVEAKPKERVVCVNGLTFDEPMLLNSTTWPLIRAKIANEFNLPNTDIQLKDSKVHIFSQTESESRSLVSEMMILAGRVIAEFSVENSISMPYLSQEPGNFSDDVIKNIKKLSPSKAFEAARGFNRSKLSVKNTLHSGLGLEAYLRVTSPMRRYLDLLVQQQLVRFITKNDLLNDTDIKERIKAVNASMSKINKATRQSVEHFRCVYFKQNKQWEGEGVIVEVKGQKASVLIPELAMITQVKFKSKVTIEEEIKLKVISSNLFERSIDFKPL